MRVLIAGCGYVGSALGVELAQDGHTVYGLRRDPRGLPAGITPIAADLLGPLSLPDVDTIVYAASPSERSPAAYEDAYVRGLTNVMAALPDVRVIFTSSTAVYAQDDGSWVDERSPAEGNRVLLEAERIARSCRGGVVLRLAGIYGPGRTWLVRRVQSGEARSDPTRYGNRIHVEDCAGALKHLLSIETPLPIYLGVDHAPAPLDEVHSFVAELLGVSAPPIGSEESRGGNKRCSNRALIASGYTFRVPSYREGYPAIVREHLATGAA
jgi:nucleoside-diphosphate-sugar epimerase